MESLIFGISKNVPFDVLTEIIVKLPGSSVISLCSTSKTFKNICEKYEDRIYTQLLLRDGYEKYEDLSAKNSYLKNFIALGQPYILDVLPDQKCGYMVQNVARIPKIEMIKGEYISEINNLDNKVLFYLGPNLYKDLTVSDFKRGKKYWVYGKLGSNNELSVGLRKNVFATPLPDKDISLVNREKLKELFPNNWNELTPFDNYKIFNQLFRILRRDGCFLYINDGEKYTYFIKQITLG